MDILDDIIKGFSVPDAVDLLLEGAAEHEALKDHTKNPYHKVITKHGFVHSETRHKQNHLVRNDPRADYTEHVYKGTKPGHRDSHIIVTQYHTDYGKVYKDDKRHYWLYRYQQENGIMAPSHGTTKPQLDRALTRDFGPPTTEAVDESLRLVKKYGDGHHTAAVYKDHEWGEYRVKHFKGGAHQEKADYHTDDSADAHATARHWVRNG